jgi:cytochrome c oxidase subunit II
MTQRGPKRVSNLPVGNQCAPTRYLPSATLFSVCSCFAFAQASPDIFKPASTPADSIHRLSVFVLVIAGLIFLVVFSLLVYAVGKFRHRASEDGREPPQVYGSNQMELAWTVVPVLIVLVLFVATARVIHSIHQAVPPPGTIRVTAIGHQFWWEFRYPELGVVTANELHVPASDPARRTPTFVTLLSADTDHSFWTPQLAGETDLIPNRVSSVWIEPHETGLYAGQCTQYCGTQHAKMFLGFTSNLPNSSASGLPPKRSRRILSTRLLRGAKSSRKPPASRGDPAAHRHLETGARNGPPLGWFRPISSSIANGCATPTRI